MKKIKMNIPLPPTEYKVSDLYISAFLLVNGLELISVDRTHPKRAVFIFQDSEIRKSLLSDFWAKKASIEPRAFITAIKEAKEMIYAE